jgi:hypothetical protein
MPTVLNEVNQASVLSDTPFGQTSGPVVPRLLDRPFLPVDDLGTFLAGLSPIL